MEIHRVSEYSFSAKYFKDYLRKNNKPFEESDKPYITLMDNDFTLSIWKDAIVIDIVDVKNIISRANIKYSDFIEEYAEHLKNI